jgi:mannosyltransferase
MVLGGIPAAAGPKRRLRRSDDLPLWALTLFAVVLACVHLTTKSLASDESISALYAQMSFGHLWHVISGPDPNMGLYYVLLHLWALVFGASPSALRGFSVLLSSTVIGLLIAVGTRLFNRRVGVIAGALIALDTAFVVSEQDVRSYGPLVAITLLSTLLFLRAMESPTAGRLTAYAVTSVAAIYTHYFAALVVLIHLLALLSRRAEQREHVRRWVLTGLTVLAACIPAAVIAGGDRSNVAWIQRPSLHDLLGFPGYLTGGDIHGGSVAAALILVVIVYGLVARFRSAERWPVLFALAWLVVPVFLNFVESRIGQSFWVNQYMIIVLPPFLLLFAAGLTSLPRRELAVGAFALTVALLAIDLRRWYNAPAIDNYRPATQYLLMHERPGDLAIYNPLTVFGVAAQLGAVDAGVAYYATRLHAQPPPPVSIGSLTNHAGRLPARVWFVMRGSLAATANTLDAAARMLHGYTEAEPTPTFENGPTVALFIRRAV